MPHVLLPTALSLLLIGLVGCADASDIEEMTPAPEAEAAATAPPDSVTEARFESLMTEAQSARWHQNALGEVVQQVGLQFLEAPYLEHTLDEGPTETLVTRLDGFDCVTFVEAALAISRGIVQQDYDFDTFAGYIQDQRYRGDATPGYCARLHYFSEWIADNHERGVIEDITEGLGGEKVDRSLVFMGENRDAYPRFAENDSLYACIEDMEASLQATNHHWHVIPEDDIEAVADQIEAGDIIGLATDIDGLDIAHTGLAYRADDGSLGLLHASLQGEVLVSPDLQSYIKQIDHQTGIVVARPLAQ